MAVLLERMQQNRARVRSAAVSLDDQAGAAQIAMDGSSSSSESILQESSTLQFGAPEGKGLRGLHQVPLLRRLDLCHAVYLAESHS